MGAAGRRSDSAASPGGSLARRSNWDDTLSARPGGVPLEYAGARSAIIRLLFQGGGGYGFPGIGMGGPEAPGLGDAASLRDHGPEPFITFPGTRDDALRGPDPALIGPGSAPRARQSTTGEGGFR
jgi:hypothetical protein